MQKLCFPPLLTAGFHDFDDDGLKRLCVDSLPKSLRRNDLYCKYIQYMKFIRDINLQIKCFSEVWIDGSFSTEKPEPDDIDLLLVLDYQALNQLPSTLHGQVGAMLDRQYVKQNFDIDVLLLAETTLKLTIVREEVTGAVGLVLIVRRIQRVW